jgi:MFS transporter, MCT family, solute carrier family 16 (monocarboxylic acid transporters), member 10
MPSSAIDSSTPDKPLVTHVEQGEDAAEQKVHASHDPYVASFPEGGIRGWLAVTGAFLTVFVGGIEYAYGVFITYYLTHNLKSYSASQIAWIGSASAFIHSTIGLVVGKLYDDGYFRHLIIFGSVLHVFSIMMLSLSTQYYQIWLTQGLAMGIATGCLFQPSVAIVSQYFERRRAFAMGIVQAGASLGGIVTPIMVNNLIPEIGFGWGVRSVGFLVLGLLIIANCIMTTRLPTRHRGTTTVHHVPGDTTTNVLVPTVSISNIPKFNYKTFFDAAYVTTVLGCFLMQMGTSLPYGYITSFGEIEGHIDPALGFYLLPLIFVGGLFGSPIWAFLGDIYGVLNVVIFSTFISSGLLALILACKSNAIAIVVSLLYGFFSAGYQAMGGPIFATLANTVLEVGHRMGIGYFVTGIATLIASPIQGALLSSDYIWWKPIFFCVLSLVSGCFLVGVGRMLLLRRRGTERTLWKTSIARI